MKSLTKKIALALVMAAVGFVAAAQTKIAVEAPNIVGSDEQFNVTFIIEGEDRPSNFNWNPGDDFTLVWGPQRGESTSIRVINGKRSKSSQFTYTYILAPKKTGKFELPAATAKMKGETITSVQAAVEVLASDSSASAQSGASSGNTQQTKPSGTISSKDLFLKFTVSRTSAVVGQPLTAELKLYQNVDIAGFEGAKFPAFNGFWSQETAAPNNINFQREEVDGRLYNSALLRRYVLIPQQVGNLVIDPAELVCLVNVRRPSHGNSIFDSFFDDNTMTVRKRVTTPAVHVHVNPLPSGAPATFGGGVGSFRISASLSKDQLKMHEATSLTVTVSGRGNVSLLEAPKVNFPADMDVYDTKTTENTDKTTGGTSGSKVFEYPFIPRSHGEFTIAPIEYSYYDVNAGKYETISTGPITFNVEKGDVAETQASTSQLVMPDRKSVKNLGEDIRFIRTRQPSYKFRTVFFVDSLWYWVTAALILLVAGLLWYLMKGMEARRADVVGNKNRKATKMALGRLKMAAGYLQKNLYSAFYEELHKALLGFASDKMNIGAEDLSKENIAAMLKEAGVAEDLSAQFVALLDACEFARYSPDGGNEAMNTHYNEAVKVISSIDSVMKTHKKNTSAAKAMILIMSMLMIPGLTHAENTAYLDSLWSKGVQAYTDGRWSECTESLKALESVGVVSPELYYNLGNAYFKSGDYPHAILYYERTLKISPSFEDARINLDFANSLIRDKIDAVPEFVLKSWARKVCYLMPSDFWALISIVLFAAALALFLVFRLGASRGLRRTGFYCSIVALILSASSFGMAQWQRNSYLKADGAIVMKPVASVKSSPSRDSSKDLFVLHEGTKVTVLDTVGEWKNISLSDGRQGWIEESDMEMI
ncbi:MAG: BatD family protein [Bacteroides sp.]|nr:BatD family protein [Bacteroides sp.]